MGDENLERDQTEPERKVQTYRECRGHGTKPVEFGVTHSLPGQRENADSKGDPHRRTCLHDARRPQRDRDQWRNRGQDDGGLTLGDRAEFGKGQPTAFRQALPEPMGVHMGQPQNDSMLRSSPRTTAKRAQWTGTAYPSAFPGPTAATTATGSGDRLPLATPPRS